MQVNFNEFKDTFFNRKVIRHKINEFKDTLFNKKVIRHKMKGIQGKNYKMGTYEINKISVSFFNDKRFLLNCRIHALAYFHKNLENGFSQMIINKMRFKKILIKRRDSHR